MTMIAQGDGRRAARIDPATGRPSGNRVLWSVQCLRALAALMIVIGHAQTSTAEAFAASGRPFARLTLLPWGGSVDLFFVISGFIMVHASRSLFGEPGGAGTFLARRLARIVPLYWLVTATFLTLLAWASYKGGDRFPSLNAILASFAFLPFDTCRDGIAFPVFDLGWTLNYELFFYVLFAMFVTLPRRLALASVLTALALLVLLGTRSLETVSLSFWTRPVILDFGLGIIVGWLEAGCTRLPAYLRLALAAGGTIVFVLDPWSLFNGALGSTVPNGFPRVFAVGLPVACVLAAATLGDEPVRPLVLAPLTRVGDASYSLYLLHPFALIVVEKLVQKFAFVRAAPAAMLVGAVLLLAVILALVSFHWIERPLTRLLIGTIGSAKRPLDFRRMPMRGRQ